jgi:hypothetical protein
MLLPAGTRIAAATTEEAQQPLSPTSESDNASSNSLGSSSCQLVEQRRLPVSGKNDRESLVALVSEVVSEGHSVLVFCGGRAAAQSCAGLLVSQLHRCRCTAVPPLFCPDRLSLLVS